MHVAVAARLRGDSDGLVSRRIAFGFGAINFHSIAIIGSSLAFTFTLAFLLLFQFLLAVIFEVYAAIVRCSIVILLAILDFRLCASHLGILALLRFSFGAVLCLRLSFFLSFFLPLVSAVLLFVRCQVCLRLLRREFGRRRGF